MNRAAPGLRKRRERHPFAAEKERFSLPCSLLS